MIDEIREIPDRAMDCLERNSGRRLPEHVPYIGMGSSYFAAVALKYAGAAICPEIASEYACYLGHVKQPHAVLISQSGYSSETLWVRDSFESCHAVVNDASSPLATSANCVEVMEIMAGEELHSSTKTYVNTLVALYTGLRIDPTLAVSTIARSMGIFEEWGNATARAIHAVLRESPEKGILILGSGPNYATAQQAALVLTETIHRPVQALTLAQYDHGPKESAENSILLAVNTPGNVFQRTRSLMREIGERGASVWEWGQGDVPEILSPIPCCIPFFFLAAHLSDKMGIGPAFRIGNKVTRVNLE